MTKLLQSQKHLKIGFFIFFLSLFAGKSAAQWTWQNPSPQGNTLESVFFVNTQVGWAVGSGGTILKTVDAGQNWEVQSARTGFLLNAVTFTGLQTGYAVGSLGKIIKTVNGGAAWFNLPVSTSRNLRGITFLDNVTGWAVGDTGTILKTTDAGQSWVAQTSGTTRNILFVKFIDAQNGIASGANGTILKTTNGGDTWLLQTSRSSAALYEINYFDAQNAYIIAYTDTILKTNNGGSTWTKQKTGILCYSGHFIDAQNGWIVGNGGAIQKTTNGGTNWTTQTKVNNNNLRSTYFSDLQNGWAVGEAGDIIRTSNGGNNWFLATKGFTTTLNGVRFADANIGLTVGDGGNIYRTTNGGNNWQSTPSGVATALYDVAMPDAQNAWVVGTGGVIRKSTDGGQSWNAQTTGTTETFLAAQLSPNFKGFAAGTKGKIVRTSDGGTNWVNCTSGTTQDLWGIHNVNDTIAYAVGFGGTIVRSTNSGVSFQTQNSGTSKWLFATSFATKSIGWAVGDSGIILKTTNQGTSWIAQNSGTNFRLLDVQFIDTQTGWATGQAAIILFTSNGGTTWTRLNNANSIGFNAMHFLNANTGFLVGGFGNIVKTGSGGGCGLNPVITGGSAFCQGSSVQLTSSYSSGNQWLYNNQPIPGKTGQTIQARLAGKYSVEVTLGLCKDTSAVKQVFYINSAYIPRSNLVVRRQNKAYIPGELPCTGDTLTLQAKERIARLKIKWLRNGVELPDTTPTLKVAQSGRYEFRYAIDGCNAVDYDTVRINFKPTPALDIPNPVLGPGPANCFATHTLFVSQAPGVSYQWFDDFGRKVPNGNSNSVTVNRPGRFTVVADRLGCKNSVSVLKESQVVSERILPDILSVSVKGTGLSQQRNVVSWERNSYDTTFIKRIVILRRNDATGKVDSLAQIPASDSSFTDHTSRPMERSYTYRLLPKRLCGNTPIPFPSSEFQESINLQVSVEESNFKILRWTKPEGLILRKYQIFRGNSFANLSLWKDSINPDFNGYIDTSNTSDFFYRIEGVSDQVYNPWGKIAAKVRTTVSNTSNTIQSVPDSCGIVAGILSETPGNACQLDTLRLFATNGLGLNTDYQAYDYQWYRNDTIIPEATYYSFTAKKSGTYSLSMRRGYCADTSAPLIVVLKPCGLVENEMEITTFSKSIIFPNPHTNVFQIRHPQSFPSCEVLLMDMQGKICKQFIYENEETFSISTEGLLPGIYFLTLKHTAGIERFKVLKQ